MSDTPWFATELVDGRTTMRLTSAWRLQKLAEIEVALASLQLPPTATIDGSALVEIDSAAALVLLRGLAPSGAAAGDFAWEGFSETNGRIIE